MRYLASSPLALSRLLSVACAPRRMSRANRLHILGHYTSQRWRAAPIAFSLAGLLPSVAGFGRVEPVSLEKNASPAFPGGLDLGGARPIAAGVPRPAGSARTGRRAPRADPGHGW